MDTTDFQLPDVGEGLTEAGVLAWLVAEGDLVEVNDLLVEVETAKAVVELPSPAAGTVLAIHVAQGETVAVGTVLVTIGDPSTVADPGPPEARPSDSSAEEDGARESEQPLVLVGTGPSAPANRTRRLTPRQDESLQHNHAPSDKTRAKPPVRALARELGVDLEQIAENDGEVTRRQQVLDRTRGSARAPSGSTDGGTTRTAIAGVRKMTAAAMTRSAFTAPHVTEWLSVDITPTMELIARLKGDRAWQGVRINPLLMVTRALLLAIRRYPAINASWDEDAQEVVEYHHVNLGIAAATPRGLVVPNIKDAGRLDLTGLATALGELVESARAGRTTPAAMSRGTITVTNIGALGVDAGAPILNPGEAAILAFGAVRQLPWVVNGQVVPRQVTQLALSFDHRLVDGELGSQVLAEVGALLSDPARALTY